MNAPEPRHEVDRVDPNTGVVETRPVADPGLEEHIERYADADAAAGRRATRQVLTMFGLAPLLAIAFIVIYFAVPGGPNGATIDFGPLHASALHLGLGLTLGLAVLLIGMGAVQWARLIMADHEIIEERHVAHSSDADKQATMAEVDKGLADSGITGSRRTILGAMAGALGLTALAPLVTLADLGPWPTPSRIKNTIEKTLWHEGTPEAPMYLVNDVTYQRIKAADLEIGQLINAEPEKLKELVGHHHQVEKAKAAIIIVRMDPNSIKVPDTRKDWDVNGILCYSKICTHVGCPISLWEQQTHHLLCPCHQSTFDLGDAGKVVFGPAARALPQLPITTDKDGYLIATRDFTVPVGPSYPERQFYPEDKGE
ncbi:cytochrome bc1 complex Rieske iron-sulfur subunit [Mariniluteicoccus flavus]